MNGEIVILDTDFLYVENDPNIFWQGASKQFEDRYQFEKNQSTVLNSLLKAAEETTRSEEITDQINEIVSQVKDIQKEEFERNNID